MSLPPLILGFFRYVDLDRIGQCINDRNGQVICLLHARKFDLKTGDCVGGDCSAILTYQIRVEGDEIVLMRN